MKIVVCCPSYKRPKVETLDYLPYVRVYVDCKEHEDYKKANPDWADIVSCPEGVQGNLCRVRNYILKSEFDNGADVVLIVDDDLKFIAYWQNKKMIIIDHMSLIPILEKYSIMCKEFGFFFWGVNVNTDKQCYREMRPFATVSYIGGPFQCFLKPDKPSDMCWYDERLPLKEDYDMTLQHCNKHRGCLRISKMFYSAKQSKQAGGCATYRNIIREKEQFELLQKKWGKSIVQQDRQTSFTKKKKAYKDYNPRIRIPIKGV